jgi:hypothetical protein
MNDLKEYATVVTRSGETTCAVIDAMVDGIDSNGEFQECLKLALTQWYQNTDEGKHAWEESSNDFNVGDLAAQQPFSRGLLKELKKVGIFNLKISIYGNYNAQPLWHFDTVLIEES